jgi:hypothetical protein
MGDTPTIEDIAKMSVPDAKGTLPALSDEHLAELKKLETNDGESEGRVTLLAAIEAEQARRVADAAAGAEGQTPPAADAAHDTDVPDGADPARWWKERYDGAMAVVTHREQQLTAIGEAVGKAAYDDLATGVVVIDRVADLAVARLAALADARSEADTLRQRIVELEQEKSLGNAPTGAPLADYRHVATVDRGLRLILLDGKAAVPLPAIPTEPGDFRQRGADTVVYEQPIVLPITAPAFRVTAVALIDDDDDRIDTCQMIPAMEAGGGRSVEVPAGTLVFRQPARSAAEAERAAGPQVQG